jgi:hypothetical protein
MTDDNENLTPARPVAPRRRLSPNPRMAQPTRRVEPEPPPPPDAPPEVPPEASPEMPAEEVAGAVAAPVVVPERPAEPEPDFPRTMRDTLRRVDESFAAFRAAAMRYPLERMDERIAEDSWTRKQMLEHVAAWHDLTAERMIKFINTGEPNKLDRDTDTFNASVARQAIGKTAGEVLKDIDATFNRLRRQLARMSDAQLAAGDWWAAWVIGGNTYGHYEEHWADIYTAEPPPGGERSRR